MGKLVSLEILTTKPALLSDSVSDGSSPNTGKVIRKVRKDSKEKMKRKLKKFKKLYIAGEISKEQIKYSYSSWVGHASHGNSYHLIENINKKYKEIFEGDGLNGKTNNKS